MPTEFPIKSIDEKTAVHSSLQQCMDAIQDLCQEEIDLTNPDICQQLLGHVSEFFQLAGFDISTTPTPDQYPNLSGQIDSNTVVSFLRKMVDDTGAHITKSVNPESPMSGDYVDFSYSASRNSIFTPNVTISYAEKDNSGGIPVHSICIHLLESSDNDFFRFSIRNELRYSDVRPSSAWINQQKRDAAITIQKV